MIPLRFHVRRKRTTQPVVHRMKRANQYHAWAVFVIVPAINIGVVPAVSIRKPTILLAATIMNVYRTTVSLQNACVLILSKFILLYWNLYYNSEFYFNFKSLKDTTIQLRFHVRLKKEKEWVVQLSLNALAPVQIQSVLRWYTISDMIIIKKVSGGIQYKESSLAQDKSNLFLISRKKIFPRCLILWNHWTK